jgi:hypothetical protein
MPHLIETIIIGKIAYKFLFYKVITSAALKFFVSVRLEEKQVAAFEIKKVDAAWKLMAPVKPSILAQEQKLIEILKKNMET